MKYIIYHLWVISLLFPLGMQAKVRLTSIWGDNMVLQQQSEVTFHGKAPEADDPKRPAWKLGHSTSYSGSRWSLYNYVF